VDGDTEVSVSDTEPDGEDSATEDATEDAWAQAMSEQAGGHPGDTDGSEESAGPAAASPAESTPLPAASEPVSETTVQDLDELYEDANGDGTPPDLDVILDIPVTLAMEVGTTDITIEELLKLGQGSVL